MTGPCVTPKPPAPLAEDVPGLWMLDPSVDFLNHGCFGARLRAVAAAQQERREWFEARPVERLERRLEETLAVAKAALGTFLGMGSGHFGFVTNATDGINAVLRSLQFGPGDEMVTTNHVYNAVKLTMRFLADRSGATMREIELPLPVSGPDSVLAAVESSLGARTRLLVIDHVSSPTAVRLPLERIIERCAERGVDVLVDGAHAPGMLDLDVESLGATYYAGNLHKWVCAPPGAAFIWVREDRRDRIHPNVISHFLGQGLAAEFGWQGTRDVSAWLCVPDAIAAVGRLGGPDGWARIRRHNHELATWVQCTLAGAWGVPASTPLDGSMLGSMASLPVPDAVRARFETPAALHDRLYDEFDIEVPVFDWAGCWMIRPSCQVYNTPGQYERLAEVVLEVGCG